MKEAENCLIENFGFISSKSDHSLFIQHTSSSMILILVYVDDIIITGSNLKKIAALIKALDLKFALKNLGNLHYFLGIEVHHTKEGLHLSQAKYVRDLLCRAQMQDAKPAPTPMTSGLKFFAFDGDPVDNPQL
uniref:Reverse transcriptase Ty1/copia-type domain-containing protein n=1 Tax=Cannabis sativa TaxID=3483 RepID=A0A803PPM4_CANSA